jgi:hypothetical protein
MPRKAKTTMARKRKTGNTLSLDRQNDPQRIFAHSLADMGNECWEGAAVTLLNFLKIEVNVSAQRSAYQNLSI